MKRLGFSALAAVLLLLTVSGCASNKITDDVMTQYPLLPVEEIMQSTRTA